MRLLRMAVQRVVPVKKVHMLRKAVQGSELTATKAIARRLIAVGTESSATLNACVKEDGPADGEVATPRPIRRGDLTESTCCHSITVPTICRVHHAAPHTNTLRTILHHGAQCTVHSARYTPCAMRRTPCTNTVHPCTVHTVRYAPLRP